MSAAKPKLVKVALSRRSVGLRAGDVVEVDAERADYLVANGNAVRVEEPAKKSAKD